MNGYTDSDRSDMHLTRIFDRLESFYGPQQANWPTEPYQFLVWWHCGYPASDAACTKGWASLNREIGIDPSTLLAAPPSKLAAALRAGGLFPETRVMRLKEIAERVLKEFGGDLCSGLAGPMSRARASLKRFPGISDPGADRILLFAGLAPIAAVPSNCPHVLVRIRKGRERTNYGANYRETQTSIENEVPPARDARERAYLLLKQHGQTLCKRRKPDCARCPIKPSCAFAAMQNPS
jgi:endonuclease-3